MTKNKAPPLGSGKNRSGPEPVRPEASARMCRKAAGLTVRG